MERPRLLLCAVLLGAVVVIVGCDRLRATPVPTATPTVDIPGPVLAARDAALSFLRERYEPQAPAAGLAWSGRRAADSESPALTTYEFAAGDWLLTVWVPMISQDVAIYEMALGNETTGFEWTGKLSQENVVQESNVGVRADVLIVRDLVLRYYRERYGASAPPERLVWLGERTTPEGSVGHEQCQFAAGGWLITVDYAVSRPDQALYSVHLADSGSGLQWRCQINAEGEILEIQAPTG